MQERERESKSWSGRVINLIGFLKSVRARKKYSNSGIAKAGFTLVELALVLVIIGLVIGGVMVGQDLIFSAKMRAQIKQVEEIETAYNTFKLKYNCTAGDCPYATQLFGTVVSTSPPRYIADGNGDGLIYGYNGKYGGATGIPPVPSSYPDCLHMDITGKASQLFLHLNLAGLGNYTADGNNDMSGRYHAYMSATAGITFPYAAFGDGTGVFISCLKSFPVWPLLMPKFLSEGNIIVIGSGSGWGAIGGQGDIDMTRRWAPVPIVGSIGMPIEVIRQIDLKTDDGIPNKGKFGVVSTDPACGGADAVFLDGNNVTSYPSPSSSCRAVGGKKIE